MNKVLLYVGFFFLITINSAFAQHVAIDSLKSIVYSSNEEENSNKTDVLCFLLENEKSADTLLKLSDILLTEAENRQELLLKGHYYRGIAFKQKGFYSQALNAFYESAKYANNISCNSCIIAANVAIGEVFSDSKNPRSAILYYNQALSLAKHEMDSLFLGSTMLKAGAEYLNLNDLDSALIYLKQSKQIFKNYDNEYGYAYSLGKIGKVYAEKGNLTRAESNISIALSLLEKHQDNTVLSIYYRYLSEIYFEKNEIKSALEYAHISLSIAQYSKQLPQKRDAYLLLSKLYTINGDVDKAFECQSNYIKVRDDINNEETIRIMGDLRTEYEVAQKQAEVDLLNKKRQTQRIVLIGLLIVLLLSGAIVLVLYSNTQKRKILHAKLFARKEELQQQKNQLEELNRTKDRFFSIISHDLRGPINVLNGTTLLIRDFLESKSYDELDELTINMEYSVKKVQTLLDNLLEWAISQQGEFPYKPEELDMDAICDEVLNIFIVMAATKSINLTYEIKPGSRFVVADKNSLMTILRNLVSNALKFTHNDGAVNITAEKIGSNFFIEVSDNGVGIKPDRQESIFTINDSKSTWGTAKEKGLGIGLSLVYEFVKMNKGEITIDSIEGLGSTFKFNIPQNGTDKATVSDIQPANNNTLTTKSPTN